ncbi:MAG TPA: MFS transporter, partial [Burkholderiaceae bacterium]|nr:MFS transporter [Burkholderiaceae bacterium]
MIRGGAFALLRQRRFAPFFWTQFFGAANDNVFKFAFTLLVTYRSASATALDASSAANLIAAAFILPFLLFSASSGQLADKFDKATLMRSVKVLEVAIMLLGAWGFVYNQFAVLLGCTFLMGVHSTLFGPAKYAYLPQHLTASEIVGGNGVVEMGTFVAILLGTILGGVLLDQGARGPIYAACVCVALALIGLLASFGIPGTPAPDPTLSVDWNPARVLWRNVRLASEQSVVFLSMLGISWMWFFGVLFLTQFPAFARDVLGGGPSVANLLLAVFTIGIATGSLACDRLSHRIVEIGLVPLGSIGMTLFGVDLFFAIPDAPLGTLQTARQFLTHPIHWRVVVDLFALSLCAGLYSVPLYALIQTRCPPSRRARIIAANNILNAVFMVVANGYAVLVLRVLGADIEQLFLLTALLNAAVAVYIYLRVPEFLLRFLSWVLVNLVYRLRSHGRERIPQAGCALLVANHVSYVDAIVLSAVSPRPIRFVMDRSIFQMPLLSWLFRHVKAIPIASARDDPVL